MTWSTIQRYAFRACNVGPILHCVSPYSTLKVTALHPDASIEKETLTKMFEQFGPVLKVRIVPKPRFAYVSYPSEKEVSVAESSWGQVDARNYEIAASPRPLKHRDLRKPPRKLVFVKQPKGFEPDVLVKRRGWVKLTASTQRGNARSTGEIIEQVRQALAQFGEILSFKELDWGAQRGFVAEFVRLEDAVRAMENTLCLPIDGSSERYMLLDHHYFNPQPTRPPTNCIAFSFQGRYANEELEELTKELTTMVEKKTSENNIEQPLMVHRTTKLPWHKPDPKKPPPPSQNQVRMLFPSVEAAEKALEVCCRTEIPGVDLQAAHEKWSDQRHSGDPTVFMKSPTD
ncbi:hypothetical protein C8J56DRAFT_948630 [Mycena floridula]|nr:hypothetical protein C8J56DRAFT_948630 [Mycena floridula]